MRIFGKFLLSLANAGICWVIWFFVLTFGVTTFSAFTRLMNAGNRMNGSLWSQRQWQSLVNDPFRDLHMSSSEMGTYQIIAGVIVLTFFMRGMLAKSLGHSFGVTLQTLAGTLSFAVLVGTAITFLQDKSSVAMLILFGGATLISLLGHSGNRLLRAPVEAENCPTETSVG